MRVYKENRTNTKTGKQAKSKKWYIDFIDHHNQRHYLAAFSDKKLSYTLADKIEALTILPGIQSVAGTKVASMD